MPCGVGCSGARVHNKTVKVVREMPSPQCLGLVRTGFVYIPQLPTFTRNLEPFRNRPLFAACNRM